MSGKQQNTKTTSPVAIDTTPNAATEVDVENDLDSSTVCSTSHYLNCGSELKGTYCHNCGLHVFVHLARFSFMFIYIRKKATRLSGFFCDPPGARTQDPNIKSVVLYQLS